MLEELMAEAQAEQDGASEDEVRGSEPAEAGGDADGTAGPRTGLVRGARFRG
ncbi:hypothetical protein ACW23B_24035 [Streptomyces albidoflavus]